MLSLFLLLKQREFFAIRRKSIVIIPGLAGRVARVLAMVGELSSSSEVDLSLVSEGLDEHNESSRIMSNVY